MNENQPVTHEVFIKRLISLCLHSGLADMPKREADKHILLKSAMLLLENIRPYTEPEINERLKIWTTQVCPIKNFDHVSLRRMLIDAGYLTRTSDGAHYEVSQAGQNNQQFASSIDQINILETLQSAREEMARQKREYLDKAKTM